MESTKLSLPLATGSAVHRGVEVLLKIDQLGLALDDPQLAGYFHEDAPFVFSGIQTIDIAVAAALTEFEQAFLNHEVDATINESMQFIHDEHAALIEGLLRLWAEHPDGLPWLLREYEVLEVERWDFKELGPAHKCLVCDGTGDKNGGECFACGGAGVIGGIILRSRADALLRKRSDGGLYVWSLKTANSWDKRRDDSGRHDVQGISEMVCIEERLRQEYKDAHAALQELGSDDQNLNEALVGAISEARIDGTQMTYLLKGRRELDENLNVYRIKTALLHPWFIDAGLLGEREYAHTYWYNCELPHDTGRTTKAGKAILCEGGKKHNIGNSWSQCNIWEHMPMKEWVALLLLGSEVQPNLPQPTWFINPQPYYRNAQEVEDWLEQVKFQEARVFKGVQEAESTKNWDGKHQEQYHQWVMNEYFPQYRRSCDHDFGGKCVFVDICFGPSAIADNPVGSGLYRLREPV